MSTLSSYSVEISIRLAIGCLTRAKALSDALKPKKPTTGDVVAPIIMTRKMKQRKEALLKAEQEQLYRDLRRETLAAIDHLRAARQSLLSALNGRLGRALRCQSCNNIATDLYIAQDCQHRLCTACLQTTMEAVFVSRVFDRAEELPMALRNPPPVITADYVRDVRNHGVDCAHYCPFCTANIASIPVKNMLYSDLLGVLPDLVHVGDPVNALRANVSSYF